MSSTESIPLLIQRDLELPWNELVTVQAGEGPAAPCDLLLVDVATESPATPEAAAAVLRSIESGLTDAGILLVGGAGRVERSALAELRNRLWPTLHVGRVYRRSNGGAVERTDVTGSARLEGVAKGDGWLILAARKAAAMSPKATQEKFDRKAAGWNGDPGSPQYGHYRWMRRLLSDCARPRSGERTLDAGSGAGWVGLEAALRGASLSAFDPSPEMVRFVEQNARDLGVEVDAKVGFMENPPFDQAYQLVLNSGVISFAPDTGAYLDGLDRLVEPGGRLVIGDLNPRSRGFRRRRAERLILPSRELNGLAREKVVELLEARGYTIEFVRYYQLTYPVPELWHRSKSKLVCWFLLQLNRLASAVDAALGSRAAFLFDSWIIGARKSG